MTSLEVAVRLLSMEAGFILLAGLLGSGPAALLPGRIPVVARIALAPPLGLALGFPVMLTVSQFLAMAVGAYAVMVPLALASAVLAASRAFRAPRERRTVRRRHLVAAAMALAIPLALLSAPLIEQRSLGPVSYQVSDAVNYASFSGHLEDRSWQDEEFGLGRADDLLVHKFLASSYFQSGTIPFASALGATFGFEAVDAQSALMIALVAIGALGCFAVVLTITGSPWAGLAAAVLYAGPVNYQLFIDGSQAALAAMAMLGPIAVLATRLPESPVRAGALFGLATVGMMTVYPAFLPLVAVGFAVAMAIHLARDRRGGSLRTGALGSLAAVAAVVVFGPVSLAKNVDYARAVADGLLNKPTDEGTWNEPVLYGDFGKAKELPTIKETFPPFYPPAEAAPAWITQSRERYDLLPISLLSAEDVAFRGIALPALVMVLAAAGAWRYRRIAFLLLAVAVSLALSYYGYQAQDCSYCGQRALLAIPPILVVLASCGLVATAGWIAARSSARSGFLVAVSAALVLVGTALYNDRALAERLVDAGYSLQPGAREVIDDAPGEVLLEGVGAGHPYTSFFESNLLPLATRVETEVRPQVDWKGLPIAIFPERYPPGLPENPDYRYVLTRIGGIESDRRVVAQRGPYALEERTAPLDVTVVNGVVADIVQRDPDGSAWVTGRITVLLADSERRPAAVTLELAGPAAESLRLGGRGQLERGRGHAVVCVAVGGDRPLRRVNVPLWFDEPTYTLDDEPHELPIPERTLELESLTAARQCPPFEPRLVR
jgi:MFS family permease